MDSIKKESMNKKKELAYEYMNQSVQVNYIIKSWILFQNVSSNLRYILKMFRVFLLE